MHKAAFLGPNAENAPEFERLLLEVLHDHVFWRRNFHPEDGRLVEEHDKQGEAYRATASRLRDELYQILAELKRGAPLYSPRQIGHMVTDPSLPALVGYFAGMLYNQNNVVAEAAPETVRKEHAYMAALARMIGYPAMLPETLPQGQSQPRPFSWGHLSSGGTAANIEALWVARNVRFYPLAVRLLAETDARFRHLNRLELATRTQARLGDLSTAALTNLTAAEVTALYLDLLQRMKQAGREVALAFQHELPSVRKVGLAGLLDAYNAHFPHDPCRLPHVFVSQAAHYGWGKAMDVIGLGTNALHYVPVEKHLRLDTDALAEMLHESDRKGHPALMVVSICGTTEEGAIDPLHQVEALREAWYEKGRTFWHHCDAAFGGFFAAMVPRDEAGIPFPYDSGVGLSDDVYAALCTLARTDSTTLDPHKLGYAPYPSGAVLFRDYHVRDAISYAAPYLHTEETAGFGGFMGQWTLEGSRPGASAVSCYLSQAVIPLTPDAHGRFVGDCVAVTHAIVEALNAQFAADTDWISLRPLAEPDTVGFCFALVPREGVHSIPQLNAFTRRIWQRFSVDGTSDVHHYNFLLSKTELNVSKYRHVLTDMLADTGIPLEDTGEPLMLLRVFVMNPFLADWNAQMPGFARLFSDYFHDVVASIYPEYILSAAMHARGGRRVKVLVVEDTPQAPASVTTRLRFDPPYAAYLDVYASPTGTLDTPVPESVDKVVVASSLQGREGWIHHLLHDCGVAPDDLLLMTEPETAVRKLVLGKGLPPGNLLPVQSGPLLTTALVRQICRNLRLRQPELTI